MAKRKTKAAATATVEKTEPTKKQDEPKVIPPEQAHQLLGVHGPYDPPRMPIPTKGYASYWDPGCSIRDMQKKQPGLFCRMAADWVDSQAFAKRTDSWKWREIRLDAAGTSKTYDEQAKEVTDGSTLPLARELVAYLVLCFLSTGERLEIPRLRCRDVMPSGRRVVVGPFRESGLEIANVADRWTSPGIALASLFTPEVPRKKR